MIQRCREICKKIKYKGLVVTEELKQWRVSIMNSTEEGGVGQVTTLSGTSNKFDWVPINLMRNGDI